MSTILMLNQSGAWRHVISFESDCLDNVHRYAPLLVLRSGNVTAKLKICEAINNHDGHGLKAGKVLENWTLQHGWIQA